MKTIKILPSKTEADFLNLLDNYSEKEFRKGIQFEKPEEEVNLLATMNILMMNCWQSLIEHPDELFVMGLSYPELGIQRSKDGKAEVFYWKMRVYKKKEKPDED